MLKTGQSEASSTWTLPGLDRVVVAAKLVADVIGALGDQLVEDLSAARTEDGRARLATRIEKDLWWLAHRPIAWVEASSRSELARIGRRIARIERRLEALAKAEEAEQAGHATAIAAATLAEKAEAAAAGVARVQQAVAAAREAARESQSRAEAATAKTSRAATASNSGRRARTEPVAEPAERGGSTPASDGPSTDWQSGFIGIPQARRRKRRG